MTADIEKFKKLYIAEFGIVLTDDEAEKQIYALMNFYKAVYGSPVIKELNKYENSIN